MDQDIDIIAVTTEPLSLAGLVEALGHATDGSSGSDPEAGALVTFSGIVRAGEGDRTITHLNYEQYEGMAVSEMKALVARARQEWPLRRVGLVHRVGAVAVGEASVLVAISAGHRVETFAAARFLIDELKKSVPIWKSAEETA
jgi:molybdopterin synthase catalytic subunit